MKKERVTCDESCAIIHTVHLLLIYEAKIQVLSLFSWKAAQPQNKNKFDISESLKFSDKSGLTKILSP